MYVQLGSEAMVNPLLVASSFGRGADFPVLPGSARLSHQLDPVSLSPAVEVSVVDLAEGVSLNPAVEVPASLAGGGSWNLQLGPLLSAVHQLRSRQ